MARRGSHGRVGRAQARKLVMDSTLEFMTSTMRKTQNRSKVLTPVDKGILRATQHVKVVARGTRVIGTLTAVPIYALPVHEGWRRTRPILPRRKKALRFRVGGRTVIVSAVNSPASYAGRPFLFLALSEVATAAGFRVYRVSP